MSHKAAERKMSYYIVRNAAGQPLDRVIANSPTAAIRKHLDQQARFFSVVRGGTLPKHFPTQATIDPTLEFVE